MATRKAQSIDWTQGCLMTLEHRHHNNAWARAIVSRMFENVEVMGDVLGLAAPIGS
jgi:hypothetical protein